MRSILLLLGVVVLSSLGCEEKKTSAPAPKPDGSAQKSPSDLKLEKAMAASAASASKQAAKAGPPEGGVFAPGAADAVMPRGGGVKIEMGSDGSEPRAAILSSAASWKGSVLLTVGVRLGPKNALPTMDYTAALGPEKKKGDREGSAGAGGGSAAAEVAFFLGDVGKAALSADQPGQLPEGVAKDVARMKGSELRWRAGDQGIALDPASKLSKEAAPDMARSLDAAAEAMFFASVPPPPKPVGAGGFWIAGSRQMLSGVEVISYRLYKVKSVGPEGVQLTVESHQYAVSGELTMPGIPKGAVLQQYEALAQGELELPPKESLAVRGHIAQQTVLGLRLEGAPPNQLASAQFSNDVKLGRSAK
jgi:hypothetical protein